MHKRVDALTNAIRAVVEHVVPWYDSAAEARSKRSGQLLVRAARRVRARADRAMSAEDVITRRPDGTCQR